jgi:glycosyltransferase involved in cell wall biosynthesis
VLAALDVFVLPSLSEGLNNTILEAMAAGLPVVATRVGGADEMVVDRRTGLLVPPGSPQTIADAVKRLLQDSSLRMAMGKAGRARAETEFDLVRTLLKYERMYTDLAREAGCILAQLRTNLQAGHVTADDRKWAGRTPWPS